MKRRVRFKFLANQEAVAGRVTWHINLQTVAVLLIKPFVQEGEVFSFAIVFIELGLRTRVNTVVKRP